MAKNNISVRYKFVSDMYTAQITIKLVQLTMPSQMIKSAIEQRYARRRMLAGRQKGS